MAGANVKNGSLVLGRAAETDPGAPAGPVTYLTMAVALKFGGRAWLKALFAAGRQIPKIPEPLYRIAFIHFLRWTIVDEVPDGDGGTRRLRPACLLFEGDFDGNIFQYVDTFIQAVPVREWAVWNQGHGFPGLRPVSRFARWVGLQSITADHYWFAYPEATVQMTGAGVRTEDALAAFEAEAAGLDDEQWFRMYERLLASVQRDI